MIPERGGRGKQTGWGGENETTEGGEAGFYLE